MDSIYFVIVLILLGLAALDLYVGVANDAVNFLNSAIGSKVAPLWVILTVASGGIIIGSIFSSGMMEIARSGVFFPEKFTFNDIMLLFMAVMITDVILLDVFNTYGMPTSTTVSLVFELLGAAVAVALVNIWQTDSGVLLDYINAEKTLTIVSAILVSVVVAFVFGSLIMYSTRLLFSFRYKSSFKIFGATWTGLSLTAITYFALFKGLKGSSLLSNDVYLYLNENTTQLLFMVFLFWTILMGVLQHLFKVNILKFNILAGTASLALAFAGNDLVNFIGVFMAGLGAYEIASGVVASGGSIENLTMGQLSGPVVADWRFLLGAGIIMILALWFSKKARTVTKTEVNLSRQDEGIENFSSTAASRSMVRSAVNINKLVSTITPVKVANFIESRFEPITDEEKQDASFDLIRASVNLTVATLLISLGTSLKLPLSTTYVTFMVAMSSSLADRAWGRESAVYRISGVLTVVSGWFITAIVAFSVSALVAFGLMYGGKFAIFAAVALVGVLMFQFFKIHKKREAKSATYSDLHKTEHDIIVNSTKEIEDAVTNITSIYKGVLDGLVKEDRKVLYKLYKQADDFHGRSKRRRANEVLPTIQQLEQRSIDTAQYYVQAVDYFYEISMSLRYIAESSYKYIDNAHEGFNNDQTNDLQQLSNKLLAVYSEFGDMIARNDYSKMAMIKERRAEILDMYGELVKNQIKRTKGKETSSRNTILYLNILNETKIIAMKSVNLMRAQMNLYNSDDFVKTNSQEQ